MNDLVAQLADSAPKLMSTKPGARLMTTVVSFASAKDRKRILKTLKGHALESILHDSAYLGEHIYQYCIELRVLTVRGSDHAAVGRDRRYGERAEVSFGGDSIDLCCCEVLGHWRRARGVAAAAPAGDGFAQVRPPGPPATPLAADRRYATLLPSYPPPSLPHLLPHLPLQESPEDSYHYLEPEDEALFDMERTNPSSSKKPPDLRRREHLAYLRAPLLAVCARYTEQLARSRPGSKVLEAVVKAFKPAAVVDAIARVFVGLDSENNEEEEDGGEDIYLGEEGAEDVEDEEAQSDMEVEEDGEEDVDEDVVEEGEEEHEGNRLLAELEEAIGAVDEKAAKKVGDVVVKEVLPIEEDGVAHVLLKKLIHFEVAQSGQKGASDANTGDAKETKGKKRKGIQQEEKKNEVDEDESKSSLAHQLLRYLRTSGKIPLWISHNRPCFALVETGKVSSVAKELKQLILPHKELLEISAGQHIGGKMLRDMMK